MGEGLRHIHPWGSVGPGAQVTVRVLWQLLHGVDAKDSVRLELDGQGVFGYKFWRPGDKTSVFAFFSVSGRPNLILEGVSGGRVIDMWGNPAARQPDSEGRLAMPLTDYPVYVEMPGEAKGVKALLLP